MTDSPIDLSHLPRHGFGSETSAFWGTTGFMVIEGTGFALALGVYFYLATINATWPINAGPPSLLWGTLITILLLLSEIPNQLIKRHAKTYNLCQVQFYLVLMTVLGLIAIAIRFAEFKTLGISHNQNAYGSILWTILGLHLTHIITDVGDTAVLTALMFTKHARGKRFGDVEDNANYWDFVVLSWLPIYVTLYWFPRWING